jgi:hypothetical protein
MDRFNIPFITPPLSFFSHFTYRFNYSHFLKHTPRPASPPFSLFKRTNGPSLSNREKDRFWLAARSFPCRIKLAENSPIDERTGTILVGIFDDNYLAGIKTTQKIGWEDLVVG